MSDAERAVFAGVMETRHGTHYRFNNQLKALKELAKRLGFYTADDAHKDNFLAQAVQELQTRGLIQRMPDRRDALGQ